MDIELTTVSANLTKFSLGNLDIYFSYSTAVAFEDGQANQVISQNKWSSTTGKHLSIINKDVADRIPYDQFKKELKKAIEKEMKTE